jgi:glutathionylspermidine synthase
MAVQGHDDLMLSAVWAFYFLKPNLIEKYFEVRQYVSDKLNQEIPLFLTSIESVDLSYNNDTTKFIEELDKKFKATTKIYNIPIQ